MKSKRVFTAEDLKDIIERYGYTLEIIEDINGACIISILDKDNDIPFHVRVNEGGSNAAILYMMDMLIDIALRTINTNDEV